MADRPARFWPLESGRIITSPFGPRDGDIHTGVDFGWPGGSAGKPVYAIQAGTVIFAGAAQGYGGPDLRCRSPLAALPVPLVLPPADQAAALSAGQPFRRPWRVKVSLLAMRLAHVAAATVPHPVRDVVRACSPSKVRQRIVVRDVVEVERLHAIGARANERFKNYDMNVLTVGPIVGPQLHSQVASTSRLRRWRQNLTAGQPHSAVTSGDDHSVDAANLAQVRHLVAAFKANNRTPSFHYSTLARVRT